MAKLLTPREPTLKATLEWSEFLAAALAAEPALRNALKNRTPRRLRPLPLARLQRMAPDEQAGVLRRWRRRELALIAWRALAGIDALDQTLAAVSQLADAALRCCEQLTRQLLVPTHGTPCGTDGQPQELLIMAMGKLGGGELNFSSDIDLIFLYPEAGETNGRRCISNEVSPPMALCFASTCACDLSAPAAHWSAASRRWRTICCCTVATGSATPG
jgi:glutamine synthetase adenylyltransferase